MLTKKGMANLKIIREQGIDAYNKGKSPISKAISKVKGEEKGESKSEIREYKRKEKS